MIAFNHWALRAQSWAIRDCRMSANSQLKSLVRGNETIYLHRSGPVLENGLDRPKNRCGRYGFPSSYSISISTVGADEARVCL